jgi:type I restriction enzyme S subunit
MENNTNRCPKIRFSGFTDAWEQRKLSEIAKIYDGTHQTPNYKSSGIMFLSVENIKDLKSNKYISKEDFDKNFKIYPLKDDILMTRIGDIGTTNIVKDNSEKAYYVSLALIKPTSINSAYLNTSIKSNFVQNGLKTRSLLTAIPMKINKDQIGYVEIKYPQNYLEQEKIGKLFEEIDNLITLHQRKYDKLTEIKKSLLEKMFPNNFENLPQIRFSGFTDAWEQRKLGEIINETIDNRGKNPPYYCESGIPIIDNFMIKNNGYPDLKIATRYLDDYLFSNFIRKYNEKDDVLITLVGNGIGNIALFPKEKSAIVQNTIGMRFEHPKKFKYYSLLSKNNEIVKLDRGMAQPSIRQDELKNLDINLPTEKEQSKIESLMTNLDNLITLHQRKLEKLKQVKASLLENMFI